MTVTGHVSYLPAIRPVRSLFAGHASDYNSAGSRQTRPQRVYRISPDEGRHGRVYLHNAYVPVEPTKGRLIDIFA